MFDFVIEWAAERFGDSMAVGPRRRDALSSEAHREAAQNLVHELVSAVDSLQGVARVVLGEKVFSGSLVLPLVYSSPPHVCEVQMRPADGYYERTGASIPAPVNPKGPHATGVALVVGLGTDYSSEYRGKEFQVSFEFTVWGEKEREAFRALFDDHRRSVDLLLDLERFEFFTAAPMAALDSYRGKRVGEMLRRYFTEPDAEPNFKIYANFKAGADSARVVRTYLILVALYDACFRTSSGDRRSRDLIPRHLHRIHPGSG